ncbi:MAG TPA: exonuclease sbcCD subunit D, partial [Chlorobaculum parvum]|nr:exonuclease sbcCD subunit D [Chlorobaculum parvum]
PDVVFERCLDVREIDEALRPALMESYREVLRSILEANVQAEEGEAG